MEHHYLSSTHKHLMWLMNSKDIHKLSSSSSSSASPSASAAAAAVFQEPVIGGFAWPPRSYSCSFCRREFRSAQALGGHMNVHRRDRARLKHHSSSSSSSPPPQILLHADETAGKFHHHHRKHAYSYKLPDDQDSMEKCGSSVGTDLVDGRTVICNKRHKISSGGISPILPLFLHGNKLVSSSAEIDLELRLGGDPILHL